MRRKLVAIAEYRRVGAAEHGRVGAAEHGRVGAAAAQVNLEVYAAASLKNALAKAKTAYEAATPGVTLTISTDASSALETKIEQGAPADVFLSADAANPKKLIDKGLANGPAVSFATNKLTVIEPTSNPATIQTPTDLAKTGIKIIAAGDAVPITKYANQLVANLAKEPGYPANFAAAYAANIVSKEDNVSAVVAKVELGRGRRRNRLRHRREGVDQGDDRLRPGLGQRGCRV